MNTASNRARRISQLRDELRPAKDRLMDVLHALEQERLGSALAKRLGTIVGRLEDLQRKMR